MVVTKIDKKLTPFNRVKGGNTKQYLVIHDVGVKGQTAKGNITYFNRAYVGASAHYFVDRASIWQLVDDNDIAWHVGDGKGKYGITNTNSLGIEMIVEKDGTIHPETKENTKWLVQHLQYKYKFPNSKIVRHYDASRKNCPQFLNKDGKWTEWNAFYNYITTPTVTAAKPKKEEKVIKLLKDSTASSLRNEFIADLEKAYKDKVFSDDKWIKLAKSGELTLADAFLLKHKMDKKK